MTQVLKINRQDPESHLIEEAVSQIRQGTVCAYPTETFYGLGVDVTSDQAIKHLYDLKRRDPGNPVAVIVSDEEMLASIVEEIPVSTRILMKNFWPGPLTILFRTNQKISKWLTTNTGKIGIRISSHPVAIALVKCLGVPLTTTSANLSGYPPSFHVRHVNSFFGEKIGLVIDGGELEPSLGSTVVDVTEEKLVLIREGVIKEDEIEKILGDPNE